MMGRLMQVMETMQANPQGAQSPHLHGYHGFVRTDPHIFTGGRDLMVADHWLRAMEQKFTLVQCTEEDKVNFAVHRL